MRRFLVHLRVFALLFQMASPFPSGALLPSLALLIIYIGLILTGSPVNVAITFAVAAALLLRASPKLRTTAVQIKKAANTTTAIVAIGLCLALPIAFLLWQMDTR